MPLLYMASQSPHSFFIYAQGGIGIDCPLAGGISSDLLILRWHLDRSVAIVTRIQAGVTEESGAGFREGVRDILQSIRIGFGSHPAPAPASCSLEALYLEVK